MLTRTLLLLILSLMAACASTPAASGPTTPPITWAVAIHGGAGTIDRNTPPEQAAAYLASLTRALDEATTRLARGESSLDVCEAVVRLLEDDELFNAGRGAALNEKGQAELDASIMDGATLRCGAVAGVRTVKNPITLARAVMEQTRHVLLISDGAEQFAASIHTPLVDPSYFVTPRRQQMLKKALEKPGARADHPGVTYGTVGCVVLDSKGNLAAATSTGGMTAKKWGRVGDSPILGAGNYADQYAAISGTGTGEEFIRHGVARMIAARVALKNETLAQAADHLVHKTLRPDDGGVIAVDAKGNIAMPFNSEGMYRACADSTGKREVRIWED
ncbi:MAG: isoaspartyl peptidase/L-asparaginase [Phycisphaerales bacterium]|nr:isoaspartyl peptidase/L-asparaginase [Phycisphaerales bacterium]